MAQAFYWIGRFLGDEKPATPVLAHALPPWEQRFFGLPDFTNWVDPGYRDAGISTSSPWPASFFTLC
jgi:hypothetical protein